MKKTLRINSLKTRTVMIAKISVFVIYVEAIIYTLLHNLHDHIFKIISVSNRRKFKNSQPQVKSTDSYKRQCMC